MTVWEIINFIVAALMGALMAFQILYILIGLFWKKRFKEAKNQHTYGILIAGRNEENVIGQLIESIKKNHYDRTKIKIFVVADNCDKTDKTAEIAREKGAVVYERHDFSKIGKSYALDFLLKNIAKDFPDYKPDGFFIFDADNLLDLNYIKEMNKAFDSGEQVITSYRSSKNFGNGLLAMGSSIHFLRECRFVHTPRAIFNISTHVSGTGFLVSSKILDPKKGWNYGKLTEDLEFSCDNLIHGRKVSYCDDAVFYDEQPEKWKQTYHQRLRWQKGMYQCFNAFGASMLTNFLTKFNFAFYDFFTFFLPLPLFSTSWAITNGIIACVRSLIVIFNGASILPVVLGLCLSLLKYFALLYAGLFVYGSLVVLKDWKRIKATSWQKIGGMFAYPLFMMTLIPICFIAVFKKVEWKPIKHTSSKNIEDFSKTPK